MSGTDTAVPGFATGSEHALRPSGMPQQHTQVLCSSTVVAGDREPAVSGLVATMPWHYALALCPSTVP
eukprot:341547-Rhodomonas_salina.1